MKSSTTEMTPKIRSAYVLRGQAIAIVALSLGLSTATLGNAPANPAGLAIGFEAAEGFEIGTELNERYGIGSDVHANIVPAQPMGQSLGQQSLALSGAGNFRLKLKRASAPDVSYWSIQVKPFTSPDIEMGTILQMAGVAIGFKRIAGEQASPVEYIGSGLAEVFLEVPNGAERSWLSTGVYIHVNASGRSRVAPEFTIRVDRRRGLADFYYRKSMILHDIPLSPRTDWNNLTIFPGSQGSAILDNIRVVPANPLFRDSDSDGIADEFEEVHRGNTSLQDRDERKGEGRFSLIELFSKRGTPEQAQRIQAQRE